MTDKSPNLQDSFLNAIRRARLPVSVFVVKGVKLQGTISWFDNFCFLLRRDGQGQLVYKHAVATIVPMGTLPGFVASFSEPGPHAQLQDRFLAAAAREKVGVTLYLVNGVVLQGSIVGFDQFSLVLERDGYCQMVYKHAISTIQPQQALALNDVPANDAPAEALG